MAQLANRDGIVEICDIFRHFKGGLYRVVGVSLGVEGLADVPRVEYRAVEGGGRFSRPKANFLEIVDRTDYDYKGPRFVFVRKA
jgi:hypothetical protein